MPELRGPIRAGVLVVGLFFGGLGWWAATAPLAGAAIAPGVVSPDGSRRTVQHLEGGIIREILVDDGSVVRPGDPLIVLEDVQARAGFDVLQTRFYTLAATQARLLAEQAGCRERPVPRLAGSRRDRRRHRARGDGRAASAVRHARQGACRPQGHSRLSASSSCARRSRVSKRRSGPTAGRSS